MLLMFPGAVSDSFLLACSRVYFQDFFLFYVFRGGTKAEWLGHRT